MEVSTLRTLIRQRVHDTGTPPLYADTVYDNEITSALRRLNFDLGSSYSTVPAVPVKYEYLLELRGTINMCLIRGGEGASNNVSGLPEGQIQTVSIPNLSVTRGIPYLQGPEYWLDMAKLLEEEYDDLVAAIPTEEQDGTSGIYVGKLTRQSLRTGGLRPYSLDKGLSATTMSLAKSGTAVNISWSAIYHDLFGYYSIERSSSATFSSYTVVGTEYDNHTVSFSDTPGNGVWYYRVVVVNMNGLRSVSATVSVTIP